MIGGFESVAQSLEVSIAQKTASFMKPRRREAFRSQTGDAENPRSR